MHKEKFKEALRKAGFNEGLADLITINSEDEITNIIGQMTPTGDVDYDEIIASEGFENYVKAKGFDKVVEASKALKSNVDRKVTTGIQNGLKNKGGAQGGAAAETQNDETPEWAKALIKDVGDLKTGKQQETFKESVTKALSGSKIPKNLQEKWANRIVEGDTSVADQIKDLEGEYSDIHGQFVSENSGGDGLPAGGVGDGEVSDADVEGVFGNS